MSTELATTNNNQVQAFDFFNPVQFDTMQRVCKMFSSSELVPDIYKVIPGKNTPEKAMSNCMIAIEIAQRIGASPLMVMQNMYIVYGKPSWSSKFLIATVNTCGRFNPLQYRFTDKGKVGMVGTFNGNNIDDIECVAFTTAKGSKDLLESSPISVKLAVQEGWYQKNGSKWQTITKQMLIYRAASFWTSAYAPELSMGMKTEDEAYDIEDVAFEDVSTKVENEIKSDANKSTIGFDAQQAAFDAQAPTNVATETVPPKNIVPPVVPTQSTSQSTIGGPGF